MSADGRGIRRPPGLQSTHTAAGGASDSPRATSAANEDDKENGGGDKSKDGDGDAGDRHPSQRHLVAGSLRLAPDTYRPASRKGSVTSRSPGFKDATNPASASPSPVIASFRGVRDPPDPGALSASSWGRRSRHMDCCGTSDIGRPPSADDGSSCSHDTTQVFRRSPLALGSTLIERCLPSRDGGRGARHRPRLVQTCKPAASRCELRPRDSHFS